MKIFTAVWGEPYLTWFEQGLVPTLFSPKNTKSLEKAKWIIATQPNDVPRISKLNIGNEVLLTTSVIEALLHTMESCIKDKEPMLMAPPDTLFSDGSINTLKEYGNRPGLCAAMAHVRVLPSILAEDFIKNNLVSLSWKHLHDSWVHAKIGPSQSNSKSGGVAWKWLDDNLIGVQHRLPTVFYANFNESDLVYFKTRNHFNIWDTTWPALLMEQQRLRYIGSSDAAFCAELTDRNMNVPIIEEVDPAEPDKYHGEYLHNKMLRQFVSIFRMWPI